MGGSLIRQEPDVGLVKANEEVWSIFQDAGWEGYIEQLQGYNDEIDLDFAKSLREER